MTPEQTQALFKLALGFISFFGLFFVLRFVSRKTKTTDDNTIWIGQEPLSVINIIEETHNIKTFTLQRQSGKLFAQFQAGQFLSFQIGDDSKQIRSYSISSPEQNLQTVQVSIKHIENGVGSGWFHKLRIGGQVQATRPSGHFTEPAGNTKHCIYIAGGIGITPILSMIRTKIEKSATSEMTLFYGMRSEKDMAFHTLLTNISKQHVQFHYYPILSHEPTWNGTKGFLDFNFVSNKIKPLTDKLYFICGPEVMTDSLIKNLLSSGISEDCIFNEQFISPATIDESNIPPREVTVHINGKSLPYKGRSNLLSFLEDQGEPLPYACRAGVCGTCKCRVTGPVKVLSNSGLTSKERIRGLTLACVAYPEGDITVETVD